MLETKKLAVIVVIVAVVLAGVGAAWLTLGGGGEKVRIDAALEVYGNANNDDRIDQRDIDIMREVISGEKSLNDHPLADANHDGSVTESDVDQVGRIMNADSSNKVRVYHINHIDGRNEVVDTLYPITSAIGTGASNSILIYKYLGIVDELKGFSWASAPDKTLFSEYSHLITADQRLETSATRIDIDKASNLVDKYGVTAAITADNRSYLTNEPVFESAGIDVVRVQPASVVSDEYMSTVLMIAFLFDTDGKGYLDKCADLIGWYENFLTDLNGKLGGIQDSRRVSAVASSSNDAVSTGSSDYTDVLRAAGATFPLTDIDDAAASVKYDPSLTWLNNYELDHVICLRTSTAAFSWYGGTAISSGSPTLTMYIKNWETLECYENNNVYAICGDMPVFLRIAYAAETMYGDVFGEGYAYNIHLDFVGKFFGWDESMIKDKPFVVTMEDLGLAH